MASFYPLRFLIFTDSSRIFGEQLVQLYLYEDVRVVGVNAYPIDPNPRILVHLTSSTINSYLVSIQKRSLSRYLRYAQNFILGISTLCLWNIP